MVAIEPVGCRGWSIISGTGEREMTERSPHNRSRRVTAPVHEIAGFVFALALSGCGSSTVHREPSLGTSASVYDDFSTGAISATKWTEGERQAVLQNQSAVLNLGPSNQLRWNCS